MDKWTSKLGLSLSDASERETVLPQDEELFDKGGFRAFLESHIGLCSLTPTASQCALVTRKCIRNWNRMDQTGMWTL